MSERMVSAPPSAAELQRLVMNQLSATARAGHVALLLAALAVVAVTASLALTEVGLAPRAQAAFGAVIVVGVSWVVYAWWALTTRRLLLPTHRVVAARMALTFSAAFSVASVLVAVLAPAGAAWSAAAAGGLMCLAAWGLLRKARVTVERLRARRHEIELALQAQSGRRG
jgi:membrane associated rhomboid family serine protease